MRLLAIVAIAGALGCSSPARAGEGLSQRTFLDVMTELRLATRAAPTPADFQYQKQQVLAKHKVTERELSDFVARHGDEPTYMSAVWDTLQRRLEPQPVKKPAEPAK